MNVNALASSILAGGVQSVNEVAEYIGKEEHKEAADEESWTLATAIIADTSY